MARLRSIIYLLYISIFIIPKKAITSSNKDALRDRLLHTACEKNSAFVFCSPSTTTKSPTTFRDSNNNINRMRKVNDNRQSNEVFRKSDFIEDDKEFQKPIIRSDKEIRESCFKYYPLITQSCGKQHLRKETVAKCMGYFRDCKQFIPQGDPLGAIANAFTSGVALNYGSFDVKGIPFYPINEEGAIGAGSFGDVGFGSWGGGYSHNVGVRDYWNQNFDVGANWYEGRYGYRTGWSVPLVQSLGVEGGGGTDVNVPIRADKLGTVDVDNHYGVGGYYKHNYHTGVDWRKGEVQNTFGVGVPFVGAGFLTGTAVAFPSIDTWLPRG
uniref:CX domain-containing protein n=1 Tax=Strongyloides stercoralis TaxID=6248 RepID=A0A0K0EM18_STRER